MILPILTPDRKKTQDRHGLIVMDKSFFKNYDPKDIKIRRLTPLECFRLQGFPDEIVKKAYEIGISDSQLYKMAGNAVTVDVVQILAEKIKNIAEN